MYKKIAFGILLLGCFFGCKFFQEEQKKDFFPVEKQIFSEEKEEILNKNQGENTRIKFPLKIMLISEKEFWALRKKFPQKTSKKDIKDLQKVKYLLKDMVTFKEDENGQIFVQEIRFRSGGIWKSKEYEEVSFVAYFPEEDILLCQDTAINDISFRLNDGKMNAQVGNPYFVKTSPNKKLRLNVYHSTNESNYFIETFKGNKWRKIIEINPIFNTLFESRLGELDSIFWEDDTIFYFADLDGLAYKAYYKAEVLFSKNINVSWENFPKLLFPVKDTTNFECFDKLPNLDKNQQKHLLSGLFPKVLQAKVVGQVPLSQQYTSLIIAFQEGESEVYSVLFNLNKNNEIIDYLFLAYDEIAESASYSTALIDEKQICVTEIVDFGEEQRENFCYKCTDLGDFSLVEVKR